MHRQAAMGQFHGHRCGQGRFPDAAFAHQHHEAVLVGSNDIDQCREARCIKGDLLMFADAFP